jgi:hypothetical protein
MPSRYVKLLDTLLSELIICWQRSQCEKLLVESAFLITQKHCTDLKQVCWQHKFANDQEEIDFFKSIHPQFAGRMMYYSIMYESLMSAPSFEEAAKTFWLRELDRFDRFHARHANVVEYLDQKCVDKDERYFLRRTGNRIIYVHEKVQFMCAEEITVWSTSAAMYFAEKSYHQYVLSKLADYLSASSQSYTIESVNIADSRKLK